MATPLEWTVSRPPFVFHWDLSNDIATLKRDEHEVWTGGLLPLFEVAQADGESVCAEAKIDPERCKIGPERLDLELMIGSLGRGKLRVSMLGESIRFERLSVEWETGPRPVVSVFFGAKLLRPDQADIVPDLSKPYWPGWKCDGYCVPSFKGGPCQSFLRRWEFGVNSTLPLGHFGPSLGTPYAAAFPRPVYSAAMGNNHGWICIGCGDVPDGAMLLRVRTSTSALEYRYREDLWGPPTESPRVWNEPIRITFAEVAWDAFDKLFATFELPGPVSSHHQQSTLNTWGDFRLRNFDLRGIIDTAHKLGNTILCIDDYWETYTSSGIPRLDRFPTFYEDLAYAKSLGMAVGYWQSSGWISDVKASGLTNDDLLLGQDGRPRRANWGFNPHEGGEPRWVIDPSSPKTIEFLRKRTRSLVEKLEAKSLKIDFAYGLPGPDVAAPRDPKLRGERFGFVLLQTIASAAKEVDPDITIQNFGIHPLLRRFADIISLDDLGDAGGHLEHTYETEAHAMWSVWAALLGRHGTAINASGGYNPAAEDETLLNAAVLGSPGVMLSVKTYEPSQPDAAARIARWQALSRWFRRTTTWRPMWLDSERGKLGMEPKLSCWGRIETFGGKDAVTALALRPSELSGKLSEELPVESWKGRWALIAQDDAPLSQSRKVAVIPFDFEGAELVLRGMSGRKTSAVWADGADTQLPAGTTTLRPTDAGRLVGYLVE